MVFTQPSMLYRLQRAQQETQTVFKGIPLGERTTRSRAFKRGAVNQGTTTTTSNQPSSPPPPRRLTRVERARLEALQSFGGSGFSDVMGGSKRRVARTLEEKKAEKEGDQDEGEGACGGKENEEDNATAVNVTTME